MRHLARLVVVLIVGMPFGASAAPFVCITGSPVANSEGVFLAYANSPLDAQPVGLRCETRDYIGKGLNATALILSAGGIASACTVVGAPATVWLEGAAVGAGLLSLVVGELPCDDRTREAQIKAMAEEVVCAELARMGITCTMNL